MYIKNKILVTFLSIAVISVLSLAISSFFSSRGALLHASTKQLETLADLKANSISTFFDGLRDDIYIAQDYYNIKTNLPTVSRFAKDRSHPDFIKAKEMLDEQLRKWLKVKNYVNDIVLVSPEGKIVYSANEGHAKLHLDKALPDPEGAAFEEGKNEIFISSIFRSPDESYGYEFGLLITVPVFDFENQFVGVAAFEIDMGPIYKMIQDTTGLGTTGETLVVRKEGDHVLFLNPLRHDPEAALKREVHFGDETSIPAQEAASGKTGAGIVRDYRNKEVLSAWRYIPTLGWGVVAKMDLREVLAPVITLRNRIAIFCLVIIVLIVIASLAIAESISGPIHRLHRGSEIIGSGNLDYKIGIGAKDEIGQLSRAFDQMTGNLRLITASRDELNKEVAERVKAAQELKASEASYRAIFESANDAIIIRDINTYEVVDANNRACEMFCYPKEEIIGLPLGIFSANFDQYPVEKLKSFYDETANGEARLFEWPVKDKFGREFWVETNAKRVIIGGKYCVLSIARDITERRQLSEQKDVFMNMVSHELRTPLGAIKESVSLISESRIGPINEKQKEMVSIAKRNADRLTRLINDVLDLQKIDAGKMGFKPEENDMNETIRETYGTMIYLAQKKGLSFTLKLYEALPRVKFDKDKIIQVLTNLVNNAIKFTENGGITITSAQGNNSIRVCVEDTGPGIKTENLPKLFQRFSQLERKPGGTGLGLAICKEIINMHRGKIGVESEFGKGTTFSFILPIKERRI